METALRKALVHGDIIEGDKFDWFFDQLLTLILRRTHYSIVRMILSYINPV